MIKSTLCYIEKDGCYLMLLRNKKEHDVNAGKWIGIGGKFEEGETAEECLKREVREETGVILTEYHFYGIIKFRSDDAESEDMYLYSASEYAGQIAENCAEGTLQWVPKEDVLNLNLWEGDRLFLREMLAGTEEINMTLEYKGDKLIQ